MKDYGGESPELGLKTHRWVESDHGISTRSLPFLIGLQPWWRLLVGCFTSVYPITVDVHRLWQIFGEKVKGTQFTQQNMMEWDCFCLWNHCYAKDTSDWCLEFLQANCAWYYPCVSASFPAMVRIQFKCKLQSNVDSIKYFSINVFVLLLHTFLHHMTFRDCRMGTWTGSPDLLSTSSWEGAFSWTCDDPFQSREANSGTYRIQQTKKYAWHNLNNKQHNAN